MLFSIITINRNNASGLDKTMASVVGQAFDDFEYIVIDGASTDDSVQVIHKYCERSDKIRWLSEPDNGIYDAMNKGASMASGDYMLFLNSGDTYASNSVLEDVKSAGVDNDLVVGRINFIDAEGRAHEDYQNVSSVHSLYGFRQSMLPHQATFVKRSTFLSIGPYDTRYKIVADWQYCLKVIMKNGCSYSTIPVTVANFDNTGVSSTDGQAMMDEINKAFKETVPATILEDYVWADRHKSDIGRLEWLDRHKCVRKFMNCVISLGRLISR